jgi:UDP-N-acetylmuramoyl-tripeptide--D-alanyl-D-alanine ligase
MTQFWTDARVREALGLAAEPDSAAAAYDSVGTDTRSLQPGSLFVALTGETFDGHAFLSQAAAAGARGAVVERVPDAAPQELVYYVVGDALEALGRLGLHRRRSLGARVCAVVGSNGKTTTKDLARTALGARYRVHATTGNLNNLIGTPLTLLAAPDDAEVLVVELGTNVPGEIEKLARIAEPDAVLVTSIGEEHLEGLGDLEGVLREETSLLPLLPADGVAIVAEEPPALPERARALFPSTRVAGWTAAADQDLRAEDIALDDEGRVRFRWSGLEVRLSMRGRLNARNALLALGIAREWEVEPRAAVRALAGLNPSKMRSEVLRIGDLVVIADCYNANPASMDAAAELLAAMPRRGGRVAVVGSMRELGPTSDVLHRRCAGTLAGAGLDLIVATGDFAAAFDEVAGALGEGIIRGEDPLAAYESLRPRLKGDEVLLLKASRGVALERLLPLLERDFGGAGVGPDEQRTNASGRGG